MLQSNYIQFNYTQLLLNLKIDKEMANELILYAVNTYALYNRARAICKNLARKRNKDFFLSIKKLDEIYICV